MAILRSAILLFFTGRIKADIKLFEVKIMFKQITIACLTIMFITFLLPASKVSALSPKTSKPVTATITQTTVQKNTQEPDENKFLAHSEKSLDKSIGILNIVATSMGVLVGLIAIVFALAAALGFFEYRRWKSLRKDAEKYRNIAKDSAEQAQKLVEDARPFIVGTKDMIRKTEDELNQIRDKFKTPPLTETPSEDLKKKLDEYGKKIELLEAFGMPLKPEDYFNHGIDLYYKGKYELALEAFNKAIKLKPDYAEAWVDKGAALGELGRIDEALKAFNKAIELNPNFAEAWYNRACIYALMKDKQNALTDLSKAIKLNSKYKEQAKHDVDFKDFWNDKEFKQIVGG